MSGAVVLGARNLGGAIATHLHDAGWSVAAVARTDESLAAVRERGITGLNADATDAGALAAAIEQAGDVELLVNAVSAARPTGGPWGGGPLADAAPEAYEAWTGAVSRQAFTFLSDGAAALRARGGGTLIQVTGGSARRAMPGRGLWAAGAAATRALTHAAAQELRTEGIHVALLIVDATIASPKTIPFFVPPKDSTSTPASRVNARTGTPRAAAAFAIRAPSMWTLMPSPCA